MRAAGANTADAGTICSATNIFARAIVRSHRPNLATARKGKPMTPQQEMDKALCDFGGTGDDCEDCNMPIPPGDPVYFFSDGGFESRDGTYVCKMCAINRVCPPMLSEKQIAAMCGGKSR